MSKIRKNGAWVDKSLVKKRVNGAWVDADKDYYVRTPNISGVPPFTFKSDGENLRDWSMTGQTVQASTPTPANPVAVEGVGERTGNLFDKSATDTTNGYDSTGRYLTNTGATGGNAGGTWRISEYITIEPNSEYRLSGFTTGINPSYCLYDANKDFISGKRYASESVLVITTPNNARYLRFSRNASTDDVTMLNTGSTALPYEPFGYKVPVNVQSGNLFDISDFSIGTTSFITKQVTLEPNTTYTMSSNCPLYNGGALIVIGNIGESFSTASNGVYPNHPITRTADANGKLLIGLRTNGSDYTLSDYDTMLNRGSTPLPYQPYSNTTTNIYLGSAVGTRRVKKLVLTGEENVTESGTNYNLSSVAPQLPISRTALICTHFTVATGTLNVGTCRFGGSSSSPNLTLVINYDNGAGGANAFKTYLAQHYANGTPVTIWYVLATPETAATNEPLMKIGSYADELTKTGAGVDIPTVSGSNTLTVNTTVQPSGMTIQSISQWV